MSVLVVQRWILARLRNRQFFSLRRAEPRDRRAADGPESPAVQEAARQPLSAFEAIDRPAMKPLPPTRYEYAEWSKAKVGIDYHAEGTALLQRAAHAGRRARHGAFTDTTAECFFKGRRVAAHVRSYQKGKHTTLPEHMPKSHRKHMKWTPGRLLNWGQNIGARHACRRAVAAREPTPSGAGLPRVPGVAEPVQDYGEERLEAACRRALTIGAPHRQTHHRDPRQARPASGHLSRRRHGGCHGLPHARQRARRDYFRDSTTTDRNHHH
jgi:hypothetical protein